MTQILKRLSSTFNHRRVPDHGVGSGVRLGHQHQVPDEVARRRQRRVQPRNPASDVVQGFGRVVLVARNLLGQVPKLVSKFGHLLLRRLLRCSQLILFHCNAGGQISLLSFKPKSTNIVIDLTRYPEVGYG